MVRAKKDTLAEIGCSAAILSIVKKYPDGRMDIITEGRQRFEILQVNQERPFLQGEVGFFEDEPSLVNKSDQATVVQLHEQLFQVLGQPPETDSPDNLLLSFRLTHELPVDLDFKQAMLEMKSESERISTLIEYYRATIPKVEKTLRVRDLASGNGHVH
jgi:ATP-dependent Lon protease